MRKTFVIFALALLLLLAGCGGGEQEAASPPQAAPETTSADASVPDAPSTTDPDDEVVTTGLAIRPVVLRTSGGERVEVLAEVADDEDERQRGLMGRTELAENAGMLFAFKREQTLSFWMKNTLIPLSIAYIAADGRIVDIQDMEPLDDEPPHYVSAEPVKYALEVNQGFFAEHGVEVGDSAEIPQEYR